jgi:hypothetical protein
MLFIIPHATPTQWLAHFGCPVSLPSVSEYFPPQTGTWLPRTRGEVQWTLVNLITTNFTLHIRAREIRARGLSDCVEDTWRNWNHAKSIQHWLELDEGHPRFQLLTEKETASVIYLLFIFINTNYIIKLSIYWLSKYFFWGGGYLLLH